MLFRSNRGPGDFTALRHQRMTAFDDLARAACGAASRIGRCRDFVDQSFEKLSCVHVRFQFNRDVALCPRQTYFASIWRQPCYNSRYRAGLTGLRLCTNLVCIAQSRTVLKSIKAYMDSVDTEVLKSAVSWLDSGHKATLATVVRTWGSAPRPVGAMLVIREDGHVVGSVSGGCEIGRAHV